MATLEITEFDGPNVNQFSASLPAVALPPLANQQVAVGASSVQSAALNAGTRTIRVRADVACRIECGASPTAAATSMPLGENETEYFQVPYKGTIKVAVIAA